MILSKSVLKRLTAMSLAMLFLCLCACDGKSKSESATQNSLNNELIANLGEPVVPPEGAEIYNIIFTVATVPPVLAALDCIENGHQTYAFIQRGKTYNGIDNVDNFHNVGFDPTSNLGEGFNTTGFDSLVNTVKDLSTKEDNSFFNIYVQEGSALRGVAVAANAGLALNKFRIIMLEDGNGAYTELNDKYIKGKNVSKKSDEVYSNYLNQVLAAKTEFDAVMAKTDNKDGDSSFKYNRAKAYALAALPNFIFHIQDSSYLRSVIESGDNVSEALLSAFGFSDSKTKCKLNLKFGKISEIIANLNTEQKNSYLTLMYDEYYDDTYKSLTRTQRANVSAPVDKLVFIGARHSFYPHFASDEKYGIGGLATDSTVPSSYAELDSKYKMPFLFSTEEDYNILLDVISKESNYSQGATQELKRQAQVALFNLYIDYIYTLKLTYSIYGEDYDLIMKGHPRESLGDSSQWGGRYKINSSIKGQKEESFIYDGLVDAALVAFHNADSVGKYIGTVPYGTAAENLAYLGVKVSICGLPSSTYNGYDTDVDVLSIMAETDEDITGTTSQVADRYAAGDLKFTDSNGEQKTTKFINTGLMYKVCSTVLRSSGNNDLANKYDKHFSEWLAKTKPGATDVNEQGVAE